MSKVAPPPELVSSVLSATFAACDANPTNAVLKGLLTLVYGVASIAVGIGQPIPRDRIEAMLKDAMDTVSQVDPQYGNDVPENMRTMAHTVIALAIQEALEIRAEQEAAAGPSIVIADR